MKNIRRLAFLILFFLVINSLSHADVRLPAIISDDMVLQQGGPVNVWGWADPGEEVKVAIAGSGSAKTVADKDGNWKLKLDAPPAGGPYQIEIAGKNTITVKNVLVGEVWLCSGQSNMGFLVREGQNAETEIAQANYPQIRLCTVEVATATQPQKDCTAGWSECAPETVANFSAAGYFFGRKLYQQLKVPIGLIRAAKGGSPVESWIAPDILASDPDYAPILQRHAQLVADYPSLLQEYQRQVAQWKQAVQQANAAGNQPPREPRLPFGPDHPLKLPGGMYNAMIMPITSFPIKGVIWYQGESNNGRAYQYRKLFPALIENWRSAWGEGDFPFLFVQIAPFKWHTPVTWAELREAQLMTLRSVPNTGMAVTTDIGDISNIHPKNKQDVGDRLALWALAKTYARDVVYSGPLYRKMKVEDNKIRLFFDYTDGGLVAKDGPLTEFTIAGSDKNFVDADAVIDGDTVLVSSDKIDLPVAVRFGWSNIPQPNFFNKAGLPASPFRTDDWPGVTMGSN